MLQAALPCLLLAPSPSRLTLMGGTNAEMAPPIDYILQVCCQVQCCYGYIRNFPTVAFNFLDSEFINESFLVNI